VLAQRHALLYHQLNKGVLPVVNPRPCPNVPNARTAILFFFVQAERSPMMVIRPRTWAGCFKCHATRYIVLVPHTKASPFNDPFIDEGVLLVVNPRSCPDVPNGHPWSISNHLSSTKSNISICYKVRLSVLRDCWQ